jgi:peptide/nickel transport system substrate-binding protein
LPNVLSLKEKYFLLSLLALSLFFGIASLWNIYLSTTEKIPAYGKEYSEALVGEPQFINPILISANDVDRDISELVYSSLIDYDKDGNLVNDLAKSYEISKDGKEYTFFLRDDIFWHDGKKFTADDVVFTISSIINPTYSSPLRSSWQGIKIEKIDDYTVKFILNNIYAPFLEKLTIGIIPKHIWESVDPKNIILASPNLKPIGTGPFKAVKLVKNGNGHIASFYLEANNNFYKKRPYLDSIVFRFYDDQEQAINAYQKKDVLGVSNISSKNQFLFDSKKTTIHKLNTPKYFAIFLNQNQSIILSDKKIRKALAMATDKKTLKKEIFLGEASITDSPILPNLPGYNNELEIVEFDPQEAKKILEKAGWKDTDGDGIREKTLSKGKDPVKLEITLATSDFADLAKAAEMIKEQWSNIGVKVNIENYGIEELKQNIIKTRKYDALIFGEVLSHEPDPFAFWHSSQKKDPGLNLSLYSNKDIDKLLEEARQTLDPQERSKKLKEFQKILTDDIPAIFLYSPKYLYPVSKKVNGINIKNIAIPSKRFLNIENWYIKTQRISKGSSQ